MFLSLEIPNRKLSNEHWMNIEGEHWSCCNMRSIVYCLIHLFLILFRFLSRDFRKIIQITRDLVKTFSSFQLELTKVYIFLSIDSQMNKTIIHVYNVSRSVNVLIYVLCVIIWSFCRPCDDEDSGSAGGLFFKPLAIAMKETLSSVSLC